MAQQYDSRPHQRWDLRAASQIFWHFIEILFPLYQAECGSNLARIGIHLPSTFTYSHISSCAPMRDHSWRSRPELGLGRTEGVPAEAGCLPEWSPGRISILESTWPDSFYSLQHQTAALKWHLGNAKPTRSCHHSRSHLIATQQTAPMIVWLPAYANEMVFNYCNSFMTCSWVVFSNAPAITAPLASGKCRVAQKRTSLSSWNSACDAEM